MEQGHFYSTSVRGPIVLLCWVIIGQKVDLKQWVKIQSWSVRLTDMVLQSPSKKLRSGVRKVAAEVWRNSRSAPPSLFWYSPTVIRVLPKIGTKHNKKYFETVSLIRYQIVNQDAAADSMCDWFHVGTLFFLILSLFLTLLLLTRITRFKVNW